MIDLLLTARDLARAELAAADRAMDAMLAAQAEAIAAHERAVAILTYAEHLAVVIAAEIDEVARRDGLEGREATERPEHPVEMWDV